MADRLVVRGRGSTTCATSRSTCPGTSSSSSPGCRGRASRRWPSTPSTPRANAATWSRCRPTPGSSWARWTSPTSTSSRGCRRPSPSTRSRPAATPARRWERSPRSTTTCGCSTPGWAGPTVPTAAVPLARQTPQQIVDRILDLPEGTRFQVLAPRGAGAQGRVRGPARRHGQAGLRPGPGRRRGGRAVRAGRGQPGPLRAAHHRGHRRPAGATRRHPPAPDRVDGDGAAPGRRHRRDRRAGRGRVRGAPHLLRAPGLHLRGLSFEEPEPRNFSFNSPYGACPACDGLGTQFEVDPELVVPDPTKTLAEDGALSPWAGGRSRWFDRMLEAVADEYGFSVETRWDKLRKADRRSSSTARGPSRCKCGTATATGVSVPSSTHYEGVVPWLQRRHSESESDAVREWTETFMREVPCPACRRGPAQARVAGRDRRRAQHLRAVQPVHHAPPRPRSTPWS